MDLSAYVLGDRGSIALTMGSFKLRLVIYFMLLALLPLVAATVAFSEVAERGETGSADSRLSTAIRVALADYQEQLDEDAAETARSLARATQVQQALATTTARAPSVRRRTFRTPLLLRGGRVPGRAEAAAAGAVPLVRVTDDEEARSATSWSIGPVRRRARAGGSRTVPRSTTAISSSSSPTAR